MGHGYGFHGGLGLYWMLMAQTTEQATAPTPADRALYCPSCGYDLRGSPGDSCPECGAAIDRETLERAQIPWSRRRTEGRLKALRQTIWQATFHTKRFAEAAAGPVDYREARRFQITVILGMVSSVGLILGACFVVAYLLEGWQYAMQWSAIAYGVGLVLLTGLLLTATVVHTYWLHPRKLPIEQQNRAVAMGYYAAAPVGLAPFTALLWVPGWIIAEASGPLHLQSYWYLGMILLLIGLGLLAIIPLAQWRIALVIARRVAQRQGLGFWSLALGLPLLWLGLALFWLVLVPATIAWVTLMLFSLASL
jgi:hypothetical protein